jgi:hypothetical protein
MPTSRKDFLRFVSRLTDLVSTYDVGQLREFKRMSKDELPMISDLISVLLRIEESTDASALIKSAPPQLEKLVTLDGYKAPLKRSKPTKKLEDLFLDRDLFPTYLSLIDFGTRFLSDKPGKSTRLRVARRFVRKIEGMPTEERKVIESILGDMSRRRGSRLHSDFLERWERVIKSGGSSPAGGPRDT